MENYILVRFSQYNEELMAFLSLFPFESFVEEDEEMLAYIAEDEWTAACQKEVWELAQRFGVDFTSEIIVPRNWNAEWEANFHPVAVSDFCYVRADFHRPSSGYSYEIVINPKMAFGTGHHETTYMMLAAMKAFDFRNKTVLDYGCGTGILAVLACMLKAASVDAVDIEFPSYENTIENAAINQTPCVQAFHGDLSVVSGKNYDFVLANINRNVLLETANELAAVLNANGNLLISGILESDQTEIIKTYTELGFRLMQTHNRGNWSALLFTKIGL